MWVGALGRGDGAAALVAVLGSRRLGGGFVAWAPLGLRRDPRWVVALARGFERWRRVDCRGAMSPWGATHVRARCGSWRRGGGVGSPRRGRATWGSLRL